MPITARIRDWINISFKAWIGQNIFNRINICKEHIYNRFKAVLKGCLMSPSLWRCLSKTVCENRFLESVYFRVHKCANFTFEAYQSDGTVLKPRFFRMLCSVPRPMQFNYFKELYRLWFQCGGTFFIEPIKPAAPWYQHVVIPCSKKKTQWNFFIGTTFC